MRNKQQHVNIIVFNVTSLLEIRESNSLKMYHVILRNYLLRSLGIHR